MANEPAFRVEKFPIGIASVGLGEIERRIPADEPPPLAPNAKLSAIGKPVPRQDARGKVTGATRFTVDLALPGMLYGRILRSTFPHARIRALDLTAAARHPEVRAAVAVAQPGDPVSGVVRYVGAPIAAIAATSPAAAEEALALIRLGAQPLQFVVDMEAARAAGAPIVHDEASAPDGHPSGWPSPPGLPIEGNVRGPATASRGDAAQGLADAEIVVEGEYRTRTQTHCCLEPHAIVVDWRADGLTVYMSTQYTAGVREELAEAFDLPLERVRVVVDGMGGGFGSKSSLGNYGRVAVALSRQAGAPVRIALDRVEEQLDAGNRPETWQRLRIGAKRDGTLTAISLQSYGSAGVAVGAGVGFFAQGLYACPNFDSAQYDVFINAGPGCAMRAPGNTPGAFAMEQAIDELAERLGLDPLALRDRIDPSPVRREERRLGALRFGWERRRAPGADAGPIKRGLGVAQSLWAANVQTRSSCEVRVDRDGAIEILSGVQDIGTGVGTVMAQTVAEVFGLRSEDIVVRIGDTAFPPGTPSYGSRATASITPPARVAAWRVLQALLREAALMLNAGADDLVAREGRIAVRGDPSRSLGFREAARRMSVDRISAVASRSDDYGGFRRRMPDAAIADQDLGGVQFAEVAVDTETGIVRVERVVAAQDCGRPMNPLLLESQVHGGVIMGLSYALLEERILDAASGRMVNPNLEQYKLAGPGETPAIEMILLENYRANSATDAYGIAEPSNIATAPAIANAVYNAIGVRLRALPMTPAAILQALGKIEKRS
ncbi:MAG: xanthine dehydrogenase family protein molybdopterin-binding subunit [Roseiarcus sp.]